MHNSIYQKYFDLQDATIARIDRAEERLIPRFAVLEDIRMDNQLKVLRAMQQNGLSQSDFFAATGYGYGDVGRDKTEAIFRDVFRAEAAIVRPGITSGTHAISAALFALLRPGDVLLAAGGAPYDTLQEVIGLKGDARGTLIEKGVTYKEVPLKERHIDLDALETALQEQPRLVHLQRSTGYTQRRAFTIDELGEAIGLIHRLSPTSIVFVDNCYGEFTEHREPIEVGADVIAGSLIKNPGGGIAVGGGYIAGKEELIEYCMNHLTAPGLGGETGLTFGTTRTTLQGFFFAPHITMEALKGALLMSEVFTELGYTCIPAADDPRSDIIEAILLEDPDKLLAFTQHIQRAASVGSDVLPLPWEMPGYTDPVVMASGGFIDGSSIEISADGPMRAPYVAYYQGGVVYEQAKLGCLLACEAVGPKDA
ncbi:MAG: methionine gamma-lyase family protein [Peptoniphilaceae bacterium]|nr:methionine gamma-lyase family protein [Peptoniphilaceae bacterium]